MYTGILLERSLWELICSIISMAPSIVFVWVLCIPLLIFGVAVVYNAIKLANKAPFSRRFW